MNARYNKKADGMPFWIIALAVIALIVMIVLISMFSKQTTRFTGQTQSCFLQGGQCSDKPCDGQTIKDTDCSVYCCVNYES